MKMSEVQYLQSAVTVCVCICVRAGASALHSASLFKNDQVRKHTMYEFACHERLFIL